MSNSIEKSGPRAPNRPFTEADMAELTKLYKNGGRTLYIATKMGRSETTIKRWLMRLNLRGKMIKRPWTVEDRETLHLGVKMGIPLRNIAETLGRSYNAVQVYYATIINRVAEERVAVEANPEIVPTPSAILPQEFDIYAKWVRAMAQRCSATESGLSNPPG